MKNNKNENKKTENKKMTVYEYEDKYVKKQNTKGAAIIIKFIIGIIGIFLFKCLLDITMSVYGMNKYAGYVAAAVSAALYIAFFIVPIIKILRTDYFMVNINSFTAKKAQQHNKELRNRIADKFIDYTVNVDGATWYSDKLIADLEKARKKGDDGKVKEILTALYTSDVKKAAKDIIVKCSVKSGLYSAVSQTDKIDASLVLVVNMQMIKDIVFLYGFRPSDAKLLNIFRKVMRNSLIAYGLGGVKIGNSVVKTMGDMAKSIPILGSAISVLVDSSVQGLSNGTLTAVIGYNTIKYLSEEYRLQDILDGIEIAENEDEFKETCSEVEKQLKGVSGITEKFAKAK